MFRKICSCRQLTPPTLINFSFTLITLTSVKSVPLKGLDPATSIIFGFKKIFYLSTITQLTLLYYFGCIKKQPKYHNHLDPHERTCRYNSIQLQTANAFDPDPPCKIQIPCAIYIFLNQKPTQNDDEYTADQGVEKIGS